MAVPASTIRALLAAHASRSPDRAAIRAPDRNALSYAELHGASLAVAAALRERGIAPSDRVALALPNGPEAAVAFLAVAAAATCAPLNPSYKEAEFAFSFAEPRRQGGARCRGSRSRCGRGRAGHGAAGAPVAPAARRP